MSRISVVKQNGKYATVRFRIPPPSKQRGRVGTRKKWKRQHPPRDFEVYVGGIAETTITPDMITPQFLLSQKHLG